MLFLYSIVIFLNSCEDVPCRKDMSNPYLNIIYRTINSTTCDTIEMGTIPRNISINNNNFINISDYITDTLSIPLSPDESTAEIRILYDTIYTYKYITDSIIDTSYIYTDTINFSDSIPEYTITKFQKELIIKSINIEHNLLLFYETDFTAVSQECGFTFEHQIDSVINNGCYINNIIIKQKSIKAADNIYEKLPGHIEILITNTDTVCNR